ncbi:class III lanthipeptide [Streptomyces sp. PTM05]|uniref:Class III lanthipeptide n=1 Tax=Streptantibioticus parmotrematis TaxID=2873249 RepID=A0ABS7QQC6_9ACTN|nr:class III lanthipeptide [Streptantibioticus parmotrematis]MBY8885397.1 class III lanthipeptide [Streptantibioticus parmotrematis]
MNAILALQNLPETVTGEEEGMAITTMTSHISIFSDCSSALDCTATL